MRLGKYGASNSSLQIIESENDKKIIQSPSRNPRFSPLKNLESGNMGRQRQQTSLTVQRNTNNKLNNLGRKLDDLQSQIHNARMDANEGLNLLISLKKQYLQSELPKIQEDLAKQVNGLQKLVKINKKEHEQRSEDIREDYKQLWEKTEDMKQQIFRLRMRTDQIQDSMGMKNLY